MARSQFLSVLINRFIPEYLREEYPKFKAFIQYYLEWLDTTGNPYQLIRDFLHFLDIDQIDSVNEADILEQYTKQYLAQFPLYRIQEIDVKLLIKHAKDFYAIKGTQKSYEFLFQIMNHVGSFSFYYPEQNIMTYSNKNHVYSGSSKYHDNEYYAYYVYEIRSDVFGYTELQDICEALLHPTGCKIFYLRIINDLHIDEYVAALSDFDMWYAPNYCEEWALHRTIDAALGNLQFDNYQSNLIVGLWDFSDVENGFTFWDMATASGNTNQFMWQRDVKLTLV